MYPTSAVGSDLGRAMVLDPTNIYKYGDIAGINGDIKGYNGHIDILGCRWLSPTVLVGIQPDYGYNVLKLITCFYPIGADSWSQFMVACCGLM